MPRNNQTETLILSTDARIVVKVETLRAIKIESILFEIVEEDWLPKSQIPYIEVTDENSNTSEYKPEDLSNESILNLQDKEVTAITYKKWLSARKVALSRLVEHFNVTLSSFEKNMREATQFWDGGKFSYCQICGRTLTHETSVEHGIGPICAQYVGQTYEREQAQEMMDAYQMVYEGQFERFDPVLEIWVAYKFRRIGRKTNTNIKQDKTTVGELAAMYQHSVRGKVSHLRWEIIREHNTREPTWTTVQREAREAREQRNREVVINESS